MFDTGLVQNSCGLFLTTFLRTPRSTRFCSPLHGRTRIYQALSTTLDILKQKGIDVTVLGPIVEYDSALPRLLADETLHEQTLNCQRHADAPELTNAIRR